MKEDFTDRLLDASLKQYSAVEAPEGFAGRLAAKQARDQRLEARGRRWWWMLVPAAATLAMVLVFWPRPTPTQVTPPSPTVSIPQPPTPIPAQQPRAIRAAAPDRPRWRTLSASELAEADFPLEILRPLEAKPLKDLEVPELEIKPLAGADQAVEETVPTIPKEPQR